MKQSDIQKYLINVENNKYFYYFLPFSIIFNYVKNWSRNRSQDQHRVDEMYDTYIKTKHLHFFLHLAFDKEEKMVCYDGNHRFKVLEKLLENNNIDPMIFISVIWQCNYTDIFEDFQNLNKQNVVPELYINQLKYSEAFTKTVEKFVNNYTNNNYKPFVKTSNNPKAPHFNINHFKEDIIKIYEKLPKEKQELSIIQDGLNKYENYIKNSIADIKNKSYDKCNKYNFWLFYRIPLDIDTIVSFC
jgi:hypothetical protein